MATTEQALIMMKAGLRKKKGDAPAVDFEAVFNDYFQPLYAFAAYRVGDRSAAEDITSQVFEKAWRSRSSFDPEKGSVSTWLFTIARRSVIDHLRRQQRQPQEELRDEVVSNNSEDPHERLEVKERNRSLGRALDALDDREREIIAMKFGGGMSNMDIAAVAELTPTNVSTILYRSLIKLNTQLEDGIENE